MKSKRVWSAAAGVIVAVAIAGGIAYASIPGPGNVFAACMLKGVGTIRLIDKSLPSTNLMSRCTDKELEVSWDQAGQPGPAGPQGPKGDAGPAGKDGLNGTNGTNGTDGKDGKSVAAASEPAGANCAGGGVQLTAVSGVTYVCNGRDGADGKDGVNGADGAAGHDGADGQDGANGHDGFSVTSAVEPAGSNCENGGSRFTAANGVTYACNGSAGSGNAPTGQDATSVFGTAELSVTPSTPATVVPGLTQTILVPVDSVVFVASDGGVRTGSLSATAFSAVDVFVAIDGQPASHGLFRRIVCQNSPSAFMFCAWSLSAAVPVSQGSHTISVQAVAPSGNGFPGASTAIVSGGNSFVNQGSLTVMVLKK
jgi:hypothetical protein